MRNHFYSCGTITIRPKAQQITTKRCKGRLFLFKVHDRYTDTVEPRIIFEWARSFALRNACVVYGNNMPDHQYRVFDELYSEIF